MEENGTTDIDLPVDIERTQGNLNVLLGKLKKLRPSNWTENTFTLTIYLALPVLCLVSILLLRVFRSDILPSFQFFMANLPLTLPIITVALSVMLRPDELTKPDGWLNLCNHFALGLVSFAIWAFVAGQSVHQYIVINPERVLNKEHSLLLVFTSFVWAGFCSVVSALANIGDRKGERKWRILQVVLVAVSFSLMLMPFYLFENKHLVEKKLGISFDEKMFTVSIPYRDPSLNQHLGRSADPITQCEIMRGVRAKTASLAISSALSEFNRSNDSIQFLPTLRDPTSGLLVRRKVEVLENLIVAQSDE